MVTLTDGRQYSRSAYVKARTKDMYDFGYLTLTEEEFSRQLDMVLRGDTFLSVIGAFIKDEVVVI